MDTKGELILIGAISPFVHRVIWALKLKGLKFEYVEVDLCSKSEILVKYNPIHKKVPVLIHGGKSIVESVVILEYIEETWPGVHRLFPDDPYERALARFWIKFGEDNIRTSFTFFVTVGEEQEKAVGEAKEVLSILEKDVLGRKKFFGGNEIGMTDLVFGWIPCFLNALEEASGVRVMGECGNDFPRLRAWCKDIRDVRVVKETKLDPVEMLSYLRRRREILISKS
ncbi:unnamed protein product [Rhodiola kirilowii]